jgi:hypothetical protein
MAWSLHGLPWRMRVAACGGHRLPFGVSHDHGCPHWLRRCLALALPSLPDVLSMCLCARYLLLLNQLSV